jgi:hypothetical protein
VDALTRRAAKYLEDCSRMASIAAWGLVEVKYVAWLQPTLDAAWEALDDAERAAVRQTLREWGQHGDGR